MNRRSGAFVGGPIGLTWAAALALSVTLAPAAAQQPRSADAGVILNENAYLRRTYRFGPNRYASAILKTDGPKILGTRRLATLKRNTQWWLRLIGRDPAKVDWRDHAVQATRGARAFNPVPTPPPPGDWMQPGFDDGAWPRLRRPCQGGRHAGITRLNLGQYVESVDLRLQGACYRARFMVTAPAAAGALTFRMAYNGGARVFVNGREIARGHLPSGPIGPDVPGAAYPAAAYRKGALPPKRTVGPVRIPAAALCQGVNVLGIEIRASRFHPVVLTNAVQPNWGGPQRPWPHGRLVSFELRGASAAVASAVRRPPGVQVWAEDIHNRVRSDDYLAPGEPAGAVRIVAARNGTYAGQVVAAADKPLTDLSARVSALKRVGGAESLPAGAVTVLYPQPYPASEWTLKRLGDERGLSASFPDQAALARYAAGVGSGPFLFDPLAPAPPKTIPANTARPVWLSVRVPAAAVAGTYRGTVTVSAGGRAIGSVPIELEVAGYTLPDPKGFQTFVACEQNPHGVAKQYKVPLWSDEHFARMEGSFRQLARVGNRWLNVPVIRRTEFGNRDDSMIRWIRKSDGSLGFDYKVLDRYLDQAVKHWGKPKVIQFVVAHGMKSAQPATPQVAAYDERTKRTVAIDVGGARLTRARKRAIWSAFATDLVKHMAGRGLDGAMYWGAPLEGEADPQLKVLLARAAPKVFWTAGPHEMMANGTFAKDERYYKIVTDIRYHGGWRSFRNDQGWKSRTLHLLNPRVGGTAFALHTTSWPFAYRVMPDRALALGRSGFARVGADEWAGVHYDGCVIPRWITGMPVLLVLWPGPDGARPSVRFEALIEGVQEAEARIFLEQACDRGRVSQAVARRVRKALADNLAETTFFLGNSLIHGFEAYHYRWQQRSRRLYRLAAEVAALEAAAKR